MNDMDKNNSQPNITLKLTNMNTIPGSVCDYRENKECEKHVFNSDGEPLPWPYVEGSLVA